VQADVGGPRIGVCCGPPHDDVSSNTHQPSEGRPDEIAVGKRLFIIAPEEALAFL
jgi:hypothetical protein